jgi:thiol-disulfide isomerase/thioredoxin
MKPAARHILMACMASALLLFQIAEGNAEIRRVSQEDLLRMIGQSRGKVVVVNFWATFCPPCRIEIPELVELRRDYGEEKLLLLGVSLDTSTAKVQAFLKDSQVNYPMYIGAPDVPGAFGVRTIPKIIVYDQEGAVALRHDGYLPSKILRSSIDRLLKKNR